MKIALASDHGGFKLKEEIYNYLTQKNIEVLDLGTNSSESCDYPIFAQKVCDSILKNETACGILICGTGIGMSIAANRNK